MMKKIEESNQNNYRVVYIISLLVITISIVCLIVNYSIGNTITWALYPIGGLIVIWATTTPALILKKFKVPGLLLGLTLTLIPFIYLIQHLVSVKGWFVPLALPISILSLIAFGISLFALVNKKINKFYSVALTIFLFGVIVNVGVAAIVYSHLNEDILFDVYRISTLSIALFLSLVLMIMGYNKGNPN